MKQSNRAMLASPPIEADAREKSTSGDRRSSSRHGTRQVAIVKSESKVISADLIEVSESGLRLMLDDTEGICHGEILSIMLLDNNVVVGRVAWIRGRQAGLELTTELTDAEFSANLDHRGEDLYRQVIRIQRRIQRACNEKE